ncbi:MAG: HAD hydrolase-like protein [Candidatus Dadabacteria bacterium]|nr:HAD hydrolase-like protein [Candidatus Dadabacteria bacterium]NIQ14035.1 HAD hydrolase-like protein [Candidatus Dadabacteria bacterium]
MNLFLFDIDGTLIRSFGAGQKAADTAFESVFGIKNVMKDIRTDGLTDPIILNKMFQKSFARNYEEEESKLFYDKYLYYLEMELGNLEYVEVLPGVFELLDTLDKRSDCILGLGTGNIEEGAWIKLDYAGLNSYFTFGGFGSDSENRKELLKIGIDKAKRSLRNGYELNSIFVIGDTPLDIINGKAAGAKTIGVATGHYTKADLEKYRPDYLLKNLTEVNMLDLPV